MTAAPVTKMGTARVVTQRISGNLTILLCVVFLWRDILTTLLKYAFPVLTHVSLVFRQLTALSAKKILIYSTNRAMSNAL